MENGIDLREALLVLWRGRYFVLLVTAFFALVTFLCVFMIPPTYEYSNIIDLNPYQIKGKEAKRLIERNQKISNSVRDLPEVTLAKLVKVSIDPDNEYTLLVSARYNDPEVCFSLVKQTCLGLIEAISNHRSEQINIEKKRSEKLLSFLDKTAEEYLLSRDDQILHLLKEDTVYRMILEEKAECLVSLNLLNFELEELEDLSSSEIGIWLGGYEGTASPVSVNKKAYIAVAAILGLMLSMFILYFRYYFFATMPAGHKEPGGKIAKDK